MDKNKTIYFPRTKEQMGQRIRELITNVRAQEGLTIYEFGKMLGGSESLVRAFSREDNKTGKLPETNTIIKMAQHLDMSIDVLLGRASDKSIGQKLAKEAVDQNKHVTGTLQNVEPSVLQEVHELGQGIFNSAGKVSSHGHVQDIKKRARKTRGRGY